MRIAFVIYDRMTALDFIGVYDPLTRLRTMDLLPDVTWEICAYTPEVRDIAGLRFVPTRVGESLGDYDLVVVPGGFGTRELAEDAGFLAWLRTAAPCPRKVSVCSGARLLGRAGFLAGKRATTHPDAFEELRPDCGALVEDQRVVEDGDIVTARGVTAAIDLGLYLVERIVGHAIQERIRRQMDYPYGA
ncbi:MAG: DJ-1/PfpI family protein [Ktedonobacterales bacterium]|nr:DJ-1/PfpI family protein [Ktedonobacterales bacterium]